MPLEAKNISFRYTRKHPWIFENLSLRIEKGERLTIFAPSGYGKTTLALLLSGYLKPNCGEILLDGKPLPDKGICPVQLIYQHPEKAINPRWRLKRVLEESGSLNPELPDAFGIEPAWLSRFPRELSGGELQRFCVAPHADERRGLSDLRRNQHDAGCNHTGANLESRPCRSRKAKHGRHCRHTQQTPRCKNSRKNNRPDRIENWRLFFFVWTVPGGRDLCGRGGLTLEHMFLFLNALPFIGKMYIYTKFP